jgi:hypothetical protein
VVAATRGLVGASRPVVSSQFSGTSQQKG